MKRKNRLADYVKGRAAVHQNQTGSGVIKDKRTKRLRSRAAKKRRAIEEQDDG